MFCCICLPESVLNLTLRLGSSVPPPRPLSLVLLCCLCWATAGGGAAAGAATPSAAMVTQTTPPIAVVPAAPVFSGTVGSEAIISALAELGLDGPEFDAISDRVFQALDATGDSVHGSALAGVLLEAGVAPVDALRARRLLLPVRADAAPLWL